MKQTNESLYLQELFLRNKRIELRCLGGFPKFGVYDNYEDFRKGVVTCRDMDMYITLNPTTKPVTNQIKTASFGETTTDKDISRIHIIPFDLDPVRETGDPSTEDELRYSKERARALMDFLTKRDWPKPYIGLSGNGVHLLYHVDLPNDERIKDVLRGIYTGLKLRFSDDLVKFDTTVRNPSRIFRLYGTVNHKSGRRSSVYLQKTSIVDKDTIAKLYQEVNPPKKELSALERKKIAGLKDVSLLDLFHEHGLYKRELIDKHAVICPWVDEHSDQDHINKTDTIVFDNGWFHCSHDSCSDKKNIDVLNFFGVFD